MNQSELFYVFGSIPLVLLCGLCAGIYFLLYVRKGTGRPGGALRIFVFTVTLLYLLLFLVIALFCAYKVFASCCGEWAVVLMAALLLAGVAVFGWMACREIFPVHKPAAEGMPSELEDELKTGGKKTESTEEWISRRLSELFDQEHIYREFELRIEDVAMRIGTNRTYLSKVLNQKFGCNFFRFVNQYRLKEACELLQSTSMPVCRVADKVGYKNINTFNSCFREHFGLSPKQWKRDNSEEQECNL